MSNGPKTPTISQDFASELGSGRVQGSCPRWQGEQGTATPSPIKPEPTAETTNGCYDDDNSGNITMKSTMRRRWQDVYADLQYKHSQSRVASVGGRPVLARTSLPQTHTCASLQREFCLCCEVTRISRFVFTTTAI